MEPLEQVLKYSPTGNSIALLGDLDAYVGNDSKTWKGVFGRNSLPNLKPSGVQLFDSYAGNSLYITNIIFSHRDCT